MKQGTEGRCKRMTANGSDNDRKLERESVIRLSHKDSRRVLELLESPPKPNTRLKAAVKAFKKLVSA